jgi:hypothetical protein
MVRGSFLASGAGILANPFSKKIHLQQEYLLQPEKDLA